MDGTLDIQSLIAGGMIAGAVGFIWWMLKRGVTTKDDDNLRRHEDSKARSEENRREIERVEKDALKRDSGYHQTFASQADLDKAVEDLNRNMNAGFDRIERKIDSLDEHTREGK